MLIVLAVMAMVVMMTMMKVAGDGGSVFGGGSSGYVK